VRIITDFNQKKKMFSAYPNGQRAGEEAIEGMEQERNKNRRFFRIIQNLLEWSKLPGSELGHNRQKKYNPRYNFTNLKRKKEAGENHHREGTTIGKEAQRDQEPRGRRLSRVPPHDKQV